VQCALEPLRNFAPHPRHTRAKASLEAALREGESLTQFIENAVCWEAEFRAEQNAAVARAKKALRAADKGLGLTTADDFLAGMKTRAQAAQQRIREAVVAGKNKRGAGSVMANLYRKGRFPMHVEADMHSPSALWIHDGPTSQKQPAQKNNFIPNTGPL
jgi:hypothetical protein